jgi:hypothetical protein
MLGAVPLIVKYGIPLVAFGIGHLVGWFTHKKYAGRSFQDIAKS